MSKAYLLEKLDEAIEFRLWDYQDYLKAIGMPYLNKVDPLDQMNMNNIMQNIMAAIAEELPDDD